MRAALLFLVVAGPLILAACSKAPEDCVSVSFPYDDKGHLLAPEKAGALFDRLMSVRSSAFEAWREDVRALQALDPNSSSADIAAAIDDLETSQGAMRASTRRLLAFVVYNQGFLAEQKLASDPAKLAINLIEDFESLSEADMRLVVTKLRLASQNATNRTGAEAAG